MSHKFHHFYKTIVMFDNGISQSSTLLLIDYNHGLLSVFKIFKFQKFAAKFKFSLSTEKSELT